MKMMFDSLGSDRLVVTGDITQTDLPRHQSSGLAIAERDSQVSGQHRDFVIYPKGMWCVILWSKRF